MKRIIQIIFATFVMSLVPTTYAMAQKTHIESPLERKARLEREAAAKKKREQEAAARRKREQTAREQEAKKQLEQERTLHLQNKAGSFWEGLAKYEENGKWGFIDKTGKAIK